MFNLLTVGFEFNETFYYSLIRVKPKSTGTDYEITVMNGDLEKLLYGNHVIKQTSSYLEIEESENTQQGLLKVAVAEALSKFLQVPLQRKARTERPLLITELSVGSRVEA